MKNRRCAADALWEEPKVAPGWPQGSPGLSSRTLLEPFGRQFLIKNRKSIPKVAQMGSKVRKKGHPKIETKINAEKGMKRMPKGLQNDAKLDAQIIFSIEKRYQNRCGNRCPKSHEI